MDQDASVDVFVPDAASAQQDFAQLQSIAAWYSVHTGTPEVLLGVRIPRERSYPLAHQDGECRILARGGMLFKQADQTIIAVQPRRLHRLYARSFSDGTRICRLDESHMRQALALSNSNAQVRERIQQLMTHSLLAGLFKFLSIRRNRQQALEHNEQIQAHLRDLVISRTRGDVHAAP